MKPSAHSHSLKKRNADFGLVNRVYEVPESIIVNDEHIGDFCFNELSKEKADTSVSRSQDRVRWGNQRGLTALEQLSRINATLNSLGGQIGALQVENKTLGEKVEALGVENKTLRSTVDQQGSTTHQLELDITGLKTTNNRQDAEIRELKQASEFWMPIRSRFFSVYIRSFHNDRHDDHNQEIVEGGNAVAHHGEPVVDALMFADRVRNDEDIYVELYGLSYEKVLVIREWHS